MKIRHINRPTRRPSQVSLAIVLLALTLPASAQEAVLDQVIVRGEGDAPASPGATAVSSGAMRTLRAATSDSATLLRDVPGMSTYGAGGVSSLPSIRGLADNRLRIKVDGMDLIASCPNHMNPPLSYLDPASIGALEVFAGITPVSVGGDSIG